MRGKRILLALVLIILSVGLLQILFCPASLDQCANESDAIDETVADSIAHSAFISQFYENIGQVNTKDVKFYGKMPGGMIGFGESSIRLWMDGTDSCVFLSFVGAYNVTPRGMDEVSQHNNYFLGSRGTFTGIRGYSQIAYEDLWPGIDLHYGTAVDGVKYEFRVEAGINPEHIRIQCEGHDSLVIGESMVSISKDNGTFVDEGLRAFQDLTDIDVAFTSQGPHIFGFKVGDYDESKELIIDPLVYSTFIGGSEGDSAESIAVDSYGNTIVTGYTYSPYFPTVNANNSTYRGLSDCFVFKLSADGLTLLYSAIIGGYEDDRATSVTVDSIGCGYVTGQTDSPDFPTANSYDNTKGNGKDCFVFKLSPDGSTLLFSTYVGGDRGDEANCLTVDASGNTYVTGYTSSPDFPTVNAYNSTYGESEDGGDCFVLKLSTDGSTLLYSTFIGGGRRDEARCLVVDSFGNVVVTGQTDSPDFPTVNAYNSTHGGERDCFVFKLSADGSNLHYSTFVGGSESEGATSVAVDASRNILVTGNTGSPDFPTVNAYNSTYGGSGDCFVFKLSADGSTLRYSTFIGGGFCDWATSITVDRLGKAYVAGATSSSDFPTLYAYNETYGGGPTWWPIMDCFVIKLSETGSLLYSTFIGGWNSDEANCIAVDAFGNVYVTGHTYSDNFPTLNAYNSTYGGDRDCFVLKLSLSGYSSVLYNALRTRILQFLRYINLVFFGVFTLFAWGFALLLTLAAWGIVVLTPIHLIRILVSRPTPDITGRPPPAHTRLVCTHCSATYLYGPQHGISTGVIKCQNCDREFLNGTTIQPDETVPMPIVHVPVAYTLLSRLRESRLNIFRRKKETE